MVLLDVVLQGSGEALWEEPEISTAGEKSSAWLHGINRAIEDLGESEPIAVALARNCTDLQIGLGTE